jgi:hypothetical protein
MNFLKLVTLILTFYIGSASAILKKSIEVAPIEITGFTAYAGLYLSAFYVSGRDAYIGTAGQVINVNKIMSTPVVVKISADGLAKIPAMNVLRSGFSVFNNVVFVVHKRTNYYLQNYNIRTKRPSDPRLPALANGETDWSKVSTEDFHFLKRFHRKSKSLVPDGDGVTRLNL